LSQRGVLILKRADPAFEPDHRHAQRAQLRGEANDQPAKVARRQSFKRINVQALHQQLRITPPIFAPALTPDDLPRLPKRRPTIEFVDSAQEPAKLLLVGDSRAWPHV